MQNMASSFSPCVLALLLSFFLFVFTWLAQAEEPLRFPSLDVSGTADSDSPTTAQILSQHTGYINLANKPHARMFYYLFKSRNDSRNDNLVLYLKGGPGYSAALAVFKENGPFYMTDNSSLVTNDYGWDLLGNILYVDHPLGTGFSTSTNIPKTSEQAAEDLYYFMLGFFAEHPELAENDLYLTGESYAAHFIPPFVARALQGNVNKEGVNMAIKGIAIGSPWANGITQFTTYRDYALNMGLISQTQYNKARGPFLECQKKAQNNCIGTRYRPAACGKANTDCNDILTKYIFGPQGPGFNYYNIPKQPCIGDLCYGDVSRMESFLNQVSVKEAIGVEGKLQFVLVSNVVYNETLGDQMRNSADGIAKLLNETNVKFLIYGGEYDLICNPPGNLKWVNEMKWSGHEGFRSASNVTFKVDRAEAGWLKGYGPLTFVTLNNAGHFIPVDQPQASFEMLTKWIDGNLS